MLKTTRLLAVLSLFLIGLACTSQILPKASNSNLFPASDSTNSEGWVLNTEISDEFEGIKIDTSKWFVEGLNDEYYIWKGRAPSQFVPHNVRIENGKLKLRTAWEPDYPFYQESYTDGNMGTSKYGEYKGEPMPITTAAVISKKRFLNGYMEIKSKVGNAAITGAFWGIGYEQELDVFEQMGNPKKPGKINEKSSLATAHDWSPPAQRPTNVFEHVENLPFRVADEFHVYGAELGEDFLKLFIDGKQVHHFTQDDVGLDWVLNNPMEIWLDSEIFFWLGLPHKEELPVDFEIEYVRVWQKPSDNLLEKDKAFFGFEGPILFENNPRPLKMVPEDSNPNEYQKFWEIDETSAKYFAIVEGDYASGVNSLHFSGFGKNDSLSAEKVFVRSPKGAINLESGTYILELKVWLDQGRVADEIHLKLLNTEVNITFDSLAQLKRRGWITLKKEFTKTVNSSATDQMQIEIKKQDLPKNKAAQLYIDDIKITKVK